MQRNMAASLIQHGAIRTTEAKAKELRRFVERLVTIARKGTLHARRQVIALLGDRRMINAEGESEENTVVQKLFNDIVPRFEDRPGGYTRIIRLSERRIGDAGCQVLLQLLGDEAAPEADEPAKTSRRGRRAAKRREAAGLDETQGDEAETEPEAETEAEQEAPPEETPSDDQQPQAEDEQGGDAEQDAPRQAPDDADENDKKDEPGE